MPAYVESFKECLTKLDLAIFEAKAQIPDDIKIEHYAAIRTSPGAWNKIYHAHMSESLTQPDLVKALFALKSGMEARIAISNVIDEAEQDGQPTLLPKIGRMRR